MTKIYYNKLVRDNVKDIIESKGESCAVRTIESEEEFQQELMKKIVEEATALSLVKTKDEFLKAVTDLMIVLETLNERLQFDDATLRQAMEANMDTKGMYHNRHFLNWSDDKTYSSIDSPQGITE